MNLFRSSCDPCRIYHSFIVTEVMTSLMTYTVVYRGLLEPSVYAQVLHPFIHSCIALSIHSFTTVPQLKVWYQMSCYCSIICLACMTSFKDLLLHAFGMNIHYTDGQADTQVMQFDSTCVDWDSLPIFKLHFLSPHLYSNPRCICLSCM